jgi:hypothetical protein
LHKSGSAIWTLQSGRYAEANERAWHGADDFVSSPISPEIRHADFPDFAIVGKQGVSLLMLASGHTLIV